MQKRDRETLQALTAIAAEYRLEVEGPFISKRNVHRRYRLVDPVTGEHRSLNAGCSASDHRAVKNFLTTARRLAGELRQQEI